MRPDATESSRPNIGRRPDPRTSKPQLTAETAKAAKMAPHAETGLEVDAENKQTEGSRSAKIQTTGESADALARPDLSAYHRPIRSTRNTNPKYVDAIWSASPIELADINKYISRARLEHG